MIVSFKVLLTIFILLVLTDKVLTAINIIQVNKNFPNATKDDYFKVEKNPLAKYFFNKTGLFWGSVIYGLMSLATIFIAYYFLYLALPDYALYIIFLIYGLVVLNNTYFLLKYSKVIL